VITSEGLTKRFSGGHVAVDHVDLDVPAGAVYGFLGPNGSGKTTTIRMLLGLIAPSEGSHSLLGVPMPTGGAAVLPQVGALVEGPAFHPYLSGRDNLMRLDAADRSVPGAKARERVGDALDRVGLSAAARKKYRAYSLGMRQRLGLAGALLRKPRLLILDEPTNGLDPRGIREIRDLLAELNDEGTTVFLSSHLLAEIDALCTRVGVMDRGRLVLQDDLDHLRAPTGRVIVGTPTPDKALALLDGRIEKQEGQTLSVRHDDPGALNAELVAAGVTVTAIGAERRTLEQVVLDATTTSSDRVA
jgi:ABC-2 type transport system ATP-binding protein